MKCLAARQGSANSQVQQWEGVGTAVVTAVVTLLLGQIYVGPNSLWAQEWAIVLCFGM